MIKKKSNIVVDSLNDLEKYFGEKTLKEFKLTGKDVMIKLCKFKTKE